MDVRDRLRSYIAEELLDGEVELSNDDNLLADGMIDSVSVVRLVSFIDSEYDFSIPHEDLTVENFRSVDSLATYLSGKTAA